MTLDEFKLVEPRLAYALSCYVHGEIDGVYQRPDGRYEAHCTIPPGDFEIAIEARCHPSCGGDRKRAWQWSDHVCCESCMADPGHYYQTVHE